MFAWVLQKIAASEPGSVISRKLQRRNNKQNDPLKSEAGKKLSGIGSGHTLCFCSISCLKGFHIVVNLCVAVMGPSICDPGRDWSQSISLVIHCLGRKLNSDLRQKDIHIAQQIISSRPAAPCFLGMEQDPNYRLWDQLCPGCHILFSFLARTIGVAFSVRLVPLWHNRTSPSNVNQGFWWLQKGPCQNDLSWIRIRFQEAYLLIFMYFLFSPHPFLLDTGLHQRPLPGNEFLETINHIWLFSASPPLRRKLGRRTSQVLSMFIEENSNMSRGSNQPEFVWLG